MPIWSAEPVQSPTPIPGLVLESGSFDALLERVRFAAPELLELNSAERPVVLSFQAECMERIAL